MDKVFEIYIPGKEPSSWVAELFLPATPWELRDAMDQLGADTLEDTDFVVEQYHRGAFLEGAFGHEVTLLQLNALARKIAGMEEWQEAAFEGLVKMEQKQAPGCLPYLKLLRLAENTDCCHVVKEAWNDSQLGRFCAENGFVQEADELPEELFELLDFERIGRETRLAEGGVFTKESGYVARHGEPRELKRVPGPELQKPSHTLLLEVTVTGLKNEPVLRLEFPTTEEHLESLERCFPLDENILRCTDCAVPFFREYIEEDAKGNTLTYRELNGFAKAMESVAERGELAKYKAVLQAADCRDVELAAELGEPRTLERYRFSPPRDETESAARYALDWLEERLGEEVEAVKASGQELDRLGRHLMEQDHVQETAYGLLRRVDCQPIQSMEREPPSMEMTM